MSYVPWILSFWALVNFRWFKPMCRIWKFLVLATTSGNICFLFFCPSQILIYFLCPFLCISFLCRSVSLQPTALRTSCCGGLVFCQCRKWRSSCWILRDHEARRGQHAHWCKGALSETMNRYSNLTLHPWWHCHLCYAMLGGYSSCAGCGYVYSATAHLPYWGTVE